MRNKTKAALLAGKQESDPTAAGVRRNLGNGNNGRFRPPSAAGLGNVQLSVGFVGGGFIALFHLQHTLVEVLGTETLKSSLG